MNLHRSKVGDDANTTFKRYITLSFLKLPAFKRYKKRRAGTHFNVGAPSIHKVGEQKSGTINHFTRVLPWTIARDHLWQKL